MFWKDMLSLGFQSMCDFILVARHHDGKSFVDALRSTDLLIQQT